MNCGLKRHEQMQRNLKIGNVKTAERIIAGLEKDIGNKSFLEELKTYNINSLKNENGFPILHYACVTKNERLVQLLIENFKDEPNKINLNLEAAVSHPGLTNASPPATPLLISCYEKEPANLRISKILMQHGAVPNKDAIIKLKFGEHSPSEDKPTKVTGKMAFTLLSIAAINGHVEVVKSLLSMRLSSDELNRVYNQNKTAFYYAVEHNHLDIAEAFIKAGVNVNIKSDPNSHSPLVCALILKQKSLVKLLIESPLLTVDAIDLMAAIMSADGKEEWWLHSLMPRVADINYQYAKEGKKTLLMIACSCGCEETVKWLLENGAEIDLTSTDGETALHFACKNYKKFKDLKIIQLFLDKGAHINKATRMTILSLAFTGGNMELVKLLLANNERELLLCACGGSQIKLVTDILKNQSVATIEKDGAAMLDAAAKSSNPLMVTFLRKLGANSQEVKNEEVIYRGASQEDDKPETLQTQATKKPIENQASVKLSIPDFEVGEPEVIKVKKTKVTPSKSEITEEIKNKLKQKKEKKSEVKLENKIEQKKSEDDKNRGKNFQAAANKKPLNPKPLNTSSLINSEAANKKLTPATKNISAEKVSTGSLSEGQEPYVKEPLKFIIIDTSIADDKLREAQKHMLSLQEIQKLLQDGEILDDATIRRAHDEMIELALACQQASYEKLANAKFPKDLICMRNFLAHKAIDFFFINDEETMRAYISLEKDSIFALLLKSYEKVERMYQGKPDIVVDYMTNSIYADVYKNYQVFEDRKKVCLDSKTLSGPTLMLCIKTVIGQFKTFLEEHNLDSFDRAQFEALDQKDKRKFRMCVIEIGCYARELRDKQNLYCQNIFKHNFSIKNNTKLIEKAQGILGINPSVIENNYTEENLSVLPYLHEMAKRNLYKMHEFIRKMSDVELIMLCIEFHNHFWHHAYDSNERLIILPDDLGFTLITELVQRDFEPQQKPSRLPPETANKSKLGNLTFMAKAVDNHDSKEEEKIEQSKYQRKKV